jgi:hypothetical protein
MEDCEVQRDHPLSDTYPISLLFHPQAQPHTNLVQQPDCRPQDEPCPPLGAQRGGVFGFHLPRPVSDRAVEDINLAVEAVGGLEVGMLISRPVLEARHISEPAGCIAVSRYLLFGLLEELQDQRVVLYRSCEPTVVPLHDTVNQLAQIFLFVT